MPVVLPPDTFGDPFSLEALPLPRPAIAYAIQHLGTDTLLDRQTGQFRPIRTPDLQPRFATFAEAFAAASNWLVAHDVAIDEHELSIVPLAYDPLLGRHVLIYGVLCGRP